jgi:glycosyltransferase involved in cell wall biosynthesis
MHKIVIARWLADVMRDDYGDECVDVVPNSVDRSQFFASVRGKQARPTVGFLYSSLQLKGVDVALQAISAVRQKIPALRVLSFGSELPVAALRLPDWVAFVHSPPQDQLRNYYAQCDAWLSASRSEGFNLTAMEAMMCRVPVVSTRTGWPLEAISSRRNGVLVDIDDAAGLANGLEWILTLSEPEWRGLSERAYATASAGSWDESARKFEMALKHACRRAARGEIAGGGAMVA